MAIEEWKNDRGRAVIRVRWHSRPPGNAADPAHPATDTVCLSVVRIGAGLSHVILASYFASSFTSLPISQLILHSLRMHNREGDFELQVDLTRLPYQEHFTRNPRTYECAHLLGIRLNDAKSPINRLNRLPCVLTTSSFRPYRVN
ncbi:hypothetical protein J6590_000174 [Homalodisca vitripennis]|nr:hypothetical protein J6590_000174 [Homalodisca vitripennis]